jgi:hypothetical protein
MTEKLTNYGKGYLVIAYFFAGVLLVAHYFGIKIEIPNFQIVVLILFFLILAMMERKGDKN